MGNICTHEVHTGALTSQYYVHSISNVYSLSINAPIKGLQQFHLLLSSAAVTVVITVRFSTRDQICQSYDNVASLKRDFLLSNQ